MYIVFKLYDGFRFDSTVVINVFINIPSPNLIIFILKLRVPEYASGLTSTPKAEFFFSCKHRKFVGQIKSQFYIDF